MVFGDAPGADPNKQDGLRAPPAGGPQSGELPAQGGESSPGPFRAL